MTNPFQHLGNPRAATALSIQNKIRLVENEIETLTRALQGMRAIFDDAQRSETVGAEAVTANLLSQAHYIFDTIAPRAWPDPAPSNVDPDD